MLFAAKRPLHDTVIVERDMREMRAAGAIADRIDVVRGRHENFVHLDMPARRQFDAGRFQRLPQFYDCSFLCREFTRLGFKALYCGQRYAGSFG